MLNATDPLKTLDREVKVSLTGMKTEITLGDIFNKPKIELFAGAPDNEFYRHCRERESGIKRCIRETMRSFHVHVLEFQNNRATILPWKKDWMRSCMTNLRNYAEYLVHELDRTRIEEYCRLGRSMKERFIPFLSDMVLLMINSYQGAVEIDIHWVSDLTLADSFDISHGEFDFNKLEKYLPKRTKEIEDLFKELDSIEFVHIQADSLKEAMQCFKSNLDKAGNLLLLTIIEGLVRSLGVYLKDKQQLSIDPTNKKKYSSLERFLKTIPWKKDLPISEINFGLLTGALSSFKENRQDKVIASLTERLGFLNRRFRENRNAVLHGEATDYASVTNCFLNLSALKEVLLTIKEYTQIYS